MNFSIIGAGKVGTAIGYKLINRGYSLQAFCTRNRTSLDQASYYLGNKGTLDVRQAAGDSGLLMICVPDHEISNVAQHIAVSDMTGKYVFHASGSLGNEALEAARSKGAFVGSIHPLQSFADVDSAIKDLKGTYFGVTASSEGLAMALKIVSDLDGFPIEIDNDNKPLYHAAACIASNYLVSLFAAAQKAVLKAGVGPDDSVKPIVKLMTSTLRNIEISGPHNALTGPISRGSLQTVKDHVEALQEVPGISAVYKMLGVETAKLSLEAGKIDEAQLDIMKTFLEDGQCPK